MQEEIYEKNKEDKNKTSWLLKKAHQSFFIYKLQMDFQKVVPEQ